MLWHPRGENRFIVGGGSQITLYEWSPDEPAIRHVTSQQDMQHMKVRLCLMFGVVENIVAQISMMNPIESTSVQ